MHEQLKFLETLCLGSFLLSMVASLPDVQFIPTAERPFVFMHLVSCTLLQSGYASGLRLCLHALRDY